MYRGYYCKIHSNETYENNDHQMHHRRYYRRQPVALL